MQVNNRHRRDEIETALGAVIASHFGGHWKIKRWRRRLSRYSSSYPVENLFVEMNRGQALRMVFKDLSPESLLPTARRVRPHFLYHPRREIEAYQSVLSQLHPGTATFYGAKTDPQKEHYWLFLERVDGPLLWQVGRMETWREAARWLAHFHNAFGTFRRKNDQPEQGQLRRLDGSFFAQWAQRAEDHLRHQSSIRGPQTRQKFERLINHYDRLVGRLVQLPTTLIHGEFYPSNIIVRGSSRSGRICPIDWELAAIGPEMLDLGALTSGAWSDDDRRDMVAAYRETRRAVDGSVCSMSDLTEAVDCCRLHLSMQLVGWAPAWSPPRQHARNWLRDAIQLAERLGV